jgi:hypothetical protein
MLALDQRFPTCGTQKGIRWYGHFFAFDKSQSWLVINGKEKQKNTLKAGMFKEIINIIELKIALSTHMFLFLNQFWPSRWYAKLF